MSAFVRVADTADIPPGEMKSFTVAHRQIVVCNIDNEFFALADECSHDSAPISDGHLDEARLVCPRHGATFDIRSGRATGPPAVVGIDKYELKIEGEGILVMVP
ncbi:MAG: non-heme iron oxygenase ferredoxin subunit [candidate division Zixibacteria bacterium]|nr:non-heme iron oxygenase ferredoxin subunit [candidate division Zixibacteria bacterium]MDH3937118.1 non-heme iron oxygenase ferredoxin subunit [candidate division Zixibacteria bacterium]